MRCASLTEALRAAAHWLLPGACLLCGAPAGPLDPLACTLCQHRWRPLPHPQCSRCGHPVSPTAPACRICTAWPEGLERVRSAVWLEGSAREAVHHLKYGGWWRVADALVGRMATVAPGRADALIPIPLSSRRQRQRGYNQATMLARALGRLTGTPLAETDLSRLRDTGTQTALTPEARRANVSGAFRAGSAVQGRRLLLVDDVFTTGATLAGAAQALLEAGAAAVDAVTFARARPPLS